MEKIAFIVDRLNQSPFNKNISTMTELDSKTSLELLDYITDIIVTIDSDQEQLLKDQTTDMKIQKIMQFLHIMKFNIPDEQIEDFQNLLINGDKEILQTIMHWLLSKFEHLQKRSYLAKFLLPIDIPSEFLSDELINELLMRLKELQTDFKEVHKNVESVRSSGTKPSELKNEIAQLEQERQQLHNKIQKMKKDMNVEDSYFRDMLKVTIDICCYN